MKRFVAKGDKVMIKPNIGWDRTPELAATTNPEVIKALVELSFEAGAKEVTVMDNTINQAQRCYARSGIAAAAKAAGAKVPFVNEFRLKKMALKGAWLKEWEVYTDFVETDKLINVPIAKHHSLNRLTIGMKNWLGALGGPRNQLHQKLDEAMVDLPFFSNPSSPFSTPTESSPGTVPRAAGFPTSSFRRPSWPALTRWPRTPPARGFSTSGPMRWSISGWPRSAVSGRPT
jgi:uncharacterized protein (DUF362 family)